MKLNTIRKRVARVLYCRHRGQDGEGIDSSREEESRGQEGRERREERRGKIRERREKKEQRRDK